jgi:hypothetical protein
MDGITNPAPFWVLMVGTTLKVHFSAGMEGITCEDPS